jgi:hypothetical protein
MGPTMAITLTPTVIGADHGRLVYRIDVVTTAGTTAGTTTISNATLVADSTPGGALNSFLTNGTYPVPDVTLLAVTAMAGTNKLRVTTILSPTAVNGQLSVVPTPNLGGFMTLVLLFNLNAAADGTYVFVVELEFNYLNQTWPPNH